MAEEEGKNPVVWPKEANEASDFDFMMVGKNDDPIMKIKKEKLNEIIVVQGESMPAVQGGATSAAAVALPAGPTGQNRWFDASWGYWKYNNVVLKNPLGTDGIPQGNDGTLYWDGTALTWKISKMQALIGQPLNGYVGYGDDRGVTGDKIQYGVDKQGLKDLNSGFSLISIDNQYFTPGQGIAITNGQAILNNGTSVTDYIDLPEDWAQIEYYHLPSTEFGIGFYNASNGYFNVVTQPQDKVLIINRSDYPGLNTAKKIRATKYTDNADYNGKFRLLIKTRTDVQNTYPSVKKKFDLVSWKNKQENNNRYVVDFDYSLLGLPVVSGVSRSYYIDITNWQEINFLLPQSSVYGLSFYNSSFALVGSISGDPYPYDIYKTIKIDEYPTATRLKIAALDSTKDRFKLSVAFSNKNKPVVSEGEINNYLKMNSYDVHYIDFSNDFKLNGLYSLATGGLGATSPEDRATEILELPHDWCYIEYDNFLSGVYGLVLFDENKNRIAGIPNSSQTEYRTVKVYRKDYITAKYFAYGWRTNLKELSFKIIRQPNKYSKFQDRELAKIQSRLSNLEITSFGDYNGENPGNKIISIKVFDNNDVAGKPYARIPSTILTNTGTILAATELRSSSSNGEDKGEFDIMLKRRVGAGDFTSTILFPNSPIYGRAMNPCFLIDRTGVHGVIGRIYLFVGTLKDPDKFATQSTTAELDLLYRYSDDDGVNWSQIQSLKDKWNTSAYTGVLPGPTNGIQLTNGSFVIPCMIVKDGAWRSGLCYKTVSSDWVFSTFTPRVNDNESVVVEYENNKVLLNCRFEGVQYKSRSVYTYDFGTGLFDLHESDRTFEPYINCQMSIEKISIDGQKMFLMSFPDKSNVLNPSPNNSRYNLTIWASLDCKKWVRVYVAHFPRQYGYGVLSFYNNQLIYCHETLDPSMEVDLQILTPLLPKITRDVNVNLKLTVEEKINMLVYKNKGWNY